MTPILPVHSTIPAIASLPAPMPSTEGPSFGSVFADTVSQVENTRQAAQVSADRFLSGEGEELHEVAMKTQQADLTFDMFMQVRNKIVSAYQEVMRMQV